MIYIDDILKPYTSYTVKDKGTTFSLYTIQHNRIKITDFELDANQEAFELPQMVKFNDNIVLNITEIEGNGFRKNFFQIVKFPPSIVHFGDGIFHESLVLKADLSVIETDKLRSHLFKNAVILGEVLLPKTLKFVDEYFFESCISLTKITFPDGLQFDKNGGQFMKCSSLTEIDLSTANMSFIPNFFFFECSSLKNIKFPKFKEIGAYSFYLCQISDFPDIYNLKLNEGSLAGTKITKFDFTKCTNVTEIQPSLFQDCYDLSEVTFVDTITEIGSYAFAGCTSLKLDKIPCKCSIGEGVFHSARGITTFDLSNMLNENIPKEIFYNSSLKKVIVPTHIKHVSEKAFKDTPLEEINAMDNLEVIEANAFQNTNIKTMDLSKTYLSSIRRYSFSNCTKLKKIIMPRENTDYIFFGTNVFINCISLETFILPIKGYFEGYAFNYCVKLKKVIVGNETVFDMPSFTGCVSLTTLTRFDGMSYHKDFISDGLKISFSDGAFRDCISIKKVILGKEIYIVGYNSFYNCTSLEYCDLSETTGFAIGSSAFQYCVNLRTIILPPFIRDVSQHSFYNIPKITIYNCGTDKKFNAVDTLSPGADVTFYSVIDVKFDYVEPTIITKCPTDPDPPEETTELEETSETETEESESVTTESEYEEETTESVTTTEVELPSRTAVEKNDELNVIDVEKKESIFFSTAAIISAVVFTIILSVVLIICIRTKRPQVENTF